MNTGWLGNEHSITRAVDLGKRFWPFVMVMYLIIFVIGM